MCLLGTLRLRSGLICHVPRPSCQPWSTKSLVVVALSLALGLLLLLPEDVDLFLPSPSVVLAVRELLESAILAGGELYKRALDVAQEN